MRWRFYQKLTAKHRVESGIPGSLCPPSNRHSPKTIDQERNFFLFFFLLILKNFLFYIGVLLINKVVLVPDAQQSDSVIQVSILFQILFPFRLLRNIDQISLCYTVGPCWLYILNTVVCECQSQTPNLSLPPGRGGSSFSKSVNLFLFCK